ncbi:MAG: hypothetical protein ACLPSH_03710 [Vulcanimicrobiaceae bacterium]
MSLIDTLIVAGADGEIDLERLEPARRAACVSSWARGWPVGPITRELDRT